MSTSPPALSVVLPVYNEADALGPLVQELGTVLDTLDRSAEIVAVDDGSTDGSFARLVELGAREPRLRVVRLARNYGQTAALAAGIEHRAQLAEERREVRLLVEDRQDDGYLGRGRVRTPSARRSAGSGARRRRA